MTRLVWLFLTLLGACVCAVQVELDQSALELVDKDNIYDDLLEALESSASTAVPETGFVGHEKVGEWVDTKVGVGRACYVDPSLHLVGTGVMESWGLHASGTGSVRMLVLRIAGNHKYTIVGENIVDVEAGDGTYSVPAAHQIHFLGGDVVGWCCETPGVCPSFQEVDDRKVQVLQRPLTEGEKVTVNEAIHFTEVEKKRFAVRGNFRMWGDVKPVPKVFGPDVVHPLGHSVSPSDAQLVRDPTSVQTAFVDTSLRFDHVGIVAEWVFFGMGEGTLHLQVYRVVNQTRMALYTLVGENVIQARPGFVHYVVPDDEQIRVELGDNVGWFYEDVGGLIGYHQESSTFAIRRAEPSSELPVAGQQIRFGREIRRTYALQARYKRPRALGPASAAQSFAEGVGLNKSVVGSESSFTIYAQDADGTRKTSGGDDFNVDVAGPAALDVDEVDNGDGTYRVTYTPLASGVYVITIKLGTENIQDSPLHIRVASGQTDPTHSVADVPQGATVYVPTSFFVESRDHFDNTVATGGEDYSVDFVGPGPVETDIEDAGAGSYKVTFTAQAVGNFTLDIVLGGKKIKGSPFHVHVEATLASASASRVQGPGVEAATAGENATFTITAVDEDGAVKKVGGDEFKVSVAGPAGITLNGTVHDLGNGNYTVRWIPTMIGIYYVNVDLLGAPLAKSPYAVKVTPGAADPTKSTAFGNGLALTVPHEVSTFNIATKDRFGNIRDRGGDEVEVHLSLPQGTSPVRANVTDQQNGGYVVSYQVDKSGNWTVTISLNGSPLAGTPVTVLSKGSGEVSASHSKAFGPGLSWAMVGANATFTIQAADLYGNDKTEGGDFFDVKVDGPGRVKVWFVDNKNGSYDVAYLATVSGSYTVLVNYKTHNITGTPVTVEVEAGPTNPLMSVATGEGLLGGETGSSHTFLVQAKDKDGNIIRRSNAQFDVAVTGAGPLDVGAVDNGDGTVEVSYTAGNEPGVYAFSVAVSGQNIQGSPYFVSIHEPGTS